MAATVHFLMALYIFLSNDDNEIKNCPLCQNFFGVALVYGHGVEIDVKAGIALIEAAANQGYAKSLTNMAVYYEKGKYVEQDLKKAYDYCQSAVEKGDAHAIKIFRRITRKYEMSMMINETKKRLNSTE